MSSPAPAPAAGLAPVTRVLVLAVAVVGFLFDTYELLMFPVIGADALAELLSTEPGKLLPVTDPAVRLWTGRMLWIAALAGGIFGLFGGLLIDRFGRKTMMVASILAYSLSPVAAAYSTELWQFVLFRCTTFIGVCVELVAAVTWLAELFADKRPRERAIAWSLAAASLGGIFVTEVYLAIVDFLKQNPAGVSWIPVPAAAWRYTLLTGLVPGAIILLLLPFVPESRVWKQKKLDGTLKRPSFGELFAPGLLRTTVVTTILSACGYAAAFGALQMTPSQIAPGLPDVAAKTAAADKALKEKAPGAAAQKKEAVDAVQARRGDIQRWQELGGLLGRILLAVFVTFVPSGALLRMFLIPGIVLFPLVYLNRVTGDYAVFAAGVFFCGLVTVAQFSYLSEFLPKVFPVHLRGTGGAFATNVGGRMLGTMAAVVNTELLAPQFAADPADVLPLDVATAAAAIGGAVYFVAFVTSFFLPKPPAEVV